MICFSDNNDFSSIKNRLYSIILENIEDVIWLYDSKLGKYTYISDSIQKLRGITADEAYKESISAAFTPSSYEKIKQYYKEAQTNFNAVTDIFEQVCIDGSIKYVEVQAKFTPDETGKLAEIIGISRDITNWILPQKKLQESEKRFRKLFENNPDAIILADLETGIILDCNENACLMNGYSKDELVGNSISILNSEEFEKLFKSAILKSNLIFKLETAKNLKVEINHRKKDGTIVPVESSITLTLICGKKVVMLIDRDISERKSYEIKMNKMAYHDFLTELPNRRNFIEKLESAINDAKSSNKMIAVYFLDLDRFKYINDTLGHETGDKILISAALRIKSILRGNDFAARMGGDEFTIMVNEIGSKENALDIAQRIVHAFQAPIIIDKNKFFIGTSVGISIFPEHGESWEILISEADTAMYEAKRKGPNNYVLYSNSIK